MSHSASIERNSEDDSYHDLPFDFRIQDDDVEQSEAASADSSNLHEENSYDDGFHWSNDQSGEPPKYESEMTSSSQLNRNAINILEIDCSNASCDYPIQNEIEYADPTAEQQQQQQLDEEQGNFIAHKGSLRRIISPTNNDASLQDPSIWPVYSIAVNISNDGAQKQYQILYSRAQYEQCIKLFTVLDTECKSSLSAESVKEFIWKYCPVVRKRDDAINSSKAMDGEEQERLTTSPTFDEVWNVVMTSDVNYHAQNVSSLPTLRLGLEGWMVFTRLISLVTYLESQRRFASRHLQQMMRHKYTDRENNSGISQKVNPNEVVVVIDNPPAGPPLHVSIGVLMKAECELGKEDKSRILVKDWMYASLSMIELDLDHTPKISNDERYWNRDRKVEIKPFLTSSDGDFILRHTGTSQSDDDNDTVTVVRRSYSDFCWLNEVLIKQKRPGHGNLCGRILPPFPPRHNSSRSGAVQYNPPLPKDVSERAVAVAKSGVGMISSVAKSLWGNYIAPATAAIGVSPLASPQNTLKEREHHYPHWSGLSDQEGVSPSQLARRMERYLNYMLENQALSTSFPLNAVLMVSEQQWQR